MSLPVPNEALYSVLGAGALWLIRHLVKYWQEFRHGGNGVKVAEIADNAKSRAELWAQYNQCQKAYMNLLEKYIAVREALAEHHRRSGGP